MHSEVSGCVGQRGFAKMNHRLDLSMEIKYIDSHGKTMHSVVSGCVGQRGFAKMKHILDLSMNIKMYGFP